MITELFTIGGAVLLPYLGYKFGKHDLMKMIVTLNEEHKESIEQVETKLKGSLAYIKKVEFDNQVLQNEVNSLNDHITYLKTYNFGLKFKPSTKLPNENLNFRGIYIFKNLENNKFYVGQATNFKKRYTQGFNRTSEGGVTKLFNDLNNKENFQYYFEPVDEILSLNYVERKYINLFNSYHNGYNDTKGNL